MATKESTVKSELPSLYSDDIDDAEEKTKSLQILSRKIDKMKKFVILTAGKAGVGKSTLINNFLQLEGEAAFKAGHDPLSVSKTVDHCDREINGAQLRVIDMPGLHAVDSGDKTDTTEENIIGDLKGITGEKGLDVIFYCISLVNRIENVDYENMMTLSKTFGSKVWKHFTFVFTYSDIIMQKGSSLKELVEKFIKALHHELVVRRKVDIEIKSIFSFHSGNSKDSENADINMFNGIVGIPVSENPGIPPEWRITLLEQVIRKCKKENIPLILQLNYIDWGEVGKSTAIVTASGVGGAVVGTAVGAGIGAIVGGLATAPIGGIGGIPTAAGGAAVGAWIGTLGGAGGIGLTALGTRIAFIIRSRNKIEKRARLKIMEMIEKEKKLAKKASQDED